MLAYLLCPAHAGPNDVKAILHAISEETGQPSPDVFEIRRIAEGDYTGRTMIKFCLHPSIPFEQKDWVEITREVAQQLRPEPYKFKFTYAPDE